MECPFLSTFDNIVDCFEECPLYNYKNNEGVCPFKQLEEENLYKSDEFEELQDILMVESLNLINEDYDKEKRAL